MSKVQGEGVTEMPRLTDSLLAKHRRAIHLAEEYRRDHGDPVDNLVALLDEIIQDGDAWQEIVDEPYG